MPVDFDILFGNTEDEKKKYSPAETLDIVIDPDEEKIQQDLNAEAPAPKKPKEFNQADFDAKKTLLKEEGYKIPDIAETQEEKGLLERGVDNIFDFLYNFDRPGSGVIAGLTEATKQTKQEINELLESDDVFEPSKRTFSQNISNQLTKQGKIIDAVIEGATVPREEQYTARELYGEIFGPENVEKLDKFFKGLAESGFVQGSKISDVIKTKFKDDPRGKAIAEALYKSNPIFPLSDMGKSAQKFAVAHIPDGIYLGTEIGLNPLTYVPFGAIPEVLKYGTKGTIKGSMAALAKLSPKVAETIEKASSKASKAVTEKFYDFYSKLYPKGAAKWAAKNVLGEEGAINTIEGIHELNSKVSTQAEEIVQGLAKNVDVPTRKGVVRKGVGKVFEAMKFAPKSKMLKALAGMEDGRVFLNDTVNVLREINDQMTAFTYGQVKEEAQALITKFMKGLPVSDEEVARVSKAFDLGSTFKGMRKTSDDALVNLEEKFAPQIKEETEAGLAASRQEALKIARARRDSRLAQLDERHKAMQEILSTSVKEAKRIQNELRKNIDWLSGETKIAAEVEVKKNLNAIRKNLDESLKDIAEKRAAKVKELRAEKNPMITKADRKRWFIERERTIGRTNVEYERMKARIIAGHKKQMLDMSAALQKKGEDFYKNSVKDLLGDYNSRTQEVQFGLPSKEDLGRMYGKSRKEIEKRFAKESAFLEKQMKKVKFIDAWNNMMTKQAQEFIRIRDKEIAKLPEAYQKLAIAVGDVMDLVGKMDVATGKLDGAMPGYFPRIAMMEKSLAGSPKMMNIMSKEEFEKGLFRVASNTGISRYTKDRIMKYYDDFKKAAEARGLTTVDDIFDIVYQRVLASKKAYVQKKTLEMVPDVLKHNAVNPSDKNVKLVRNYIQYLNNNGSQIENAVNRSIGGLLRAYNFFNKTWLTTMSPVFHMTNTASAPFMTGAKAGVDAFNPATYTEAVLAKLGMVQDITRKGEKIPLDAFLRAGKEVNALGSSFASKDITKNVDMILNRYPKGDVRHWMVKSMAVGNEIEELNRLHAAMVFWKQGKSLSEAWRGSKAAQFDYGDTNEMLKAMNGLFAFSTWKYKNLAAQTKMMFEDPKQLAILSGLVRNLSSGNVPTDQEVQALNAYSPEQLAIVQDGVKGLVDVTKFGFLPSQDNYKNIRRLVTGDVDGFLGDQATALAPVLKPFFKSIGQSLQAKLGYETEDYPKLSENLNYLFLSNPKAVSILNKIQKAVSGEPVRIEDVPVWDRGEQRMEKRVRVSPWMATFLSSMPFSRQLGEAGKAIRIAAEKHGMGPGPYTLGELLGMGEFATPEDLLAMGLQLNREEVDMQRLVELFKKKADKAVTEKLQNVGLFYVPEYLPTKETGKKLKAIKSERRRRANED